MRGLVPRIPMHLAMPRLTHRDGRHKAGHDDAVDLSHSSMTICSSSTTFFQFAISSVIEGMPNVLLEALAAERAVVATSVGGIPEIVTDGKSGVLVPPSDPAALAAGMLRLLESPAEAALFGAAGRRVAESRFGVGTMVERFTQLYDELLAEHGLAPAATRPVPHLVTGRG